MNLFDVYPLFPITIAKGQGCWVYDNEGKKYLDFYGGHAVISIGHSHPHYLDRIDKQLHTLGFYSNAVQMPIQQEMSKQLGKISGYSDYSLFLCNSGAEANENALKLASFHTKRSGVVTFQGAFHGRTSLAVAVTDNKKIQAPINRKEEVYTAEWNNLTRVQEYIEKGNIAAVIIEGIQGIGGIHVPDQSFLKELRELCTQTGTVLILDEIQSGFGRTGTFFAHQYSEIKPDIISVAKGMGNGFPVGGILISPQFQASYGLLGTTFGGNPLACAAVLGVIETIASENLMENALEQGTYLMEQLAEIEPIVQVRGRGLMIAIDFPFEIKELRRALLMEHNVFTGSAKTPHTLRLLPPLTISQAESDQFLHSLKAVLK